MRFQRKKEYKRYFSVRMNRRWEQMANERKREEGVSDTGQELLLRDYISGDTI